MANNKTTYKKHAMYTQKIAKNSTGVCNKVINKSVSSNGRSEFSSAADAEWCLRVLKNDNIQKIYTYIYIHT